MRVTPNARNMPMILELTLRSASQHKCHNAWTEPIF
jgi:hypothetical protein